MARGRKACACEHRIDLAPQVRDGARGMVIRRRSEKADDAELAGEPAVRIEALDPDIIHVGTAMHTRAHR